MGKGWRWLHAVAHMAGGLDLYVTGTKGKP